MKKTKRFSKDAFAQQIVDGIKRAGENRTLIYDKDEFAIRTPEKNGCAVNLRNAFSEFCAVFGEHFAVGLVYDLPEAMRHITQTDLEKWGVTLNEALEVAKQNLAKMQFTLAGPHRGEGICWCSIQKDSYDAARILLLDKIRGFPVRGDIVAMIPNRETLYLAGSEDLHALTEMLKSATEAVQQPRYISGIALRLVGDDWKPWLPEQDHPFYSDFRKLQTQTFGRAYANQKELLDKLHEKTGQHICVASFSGMTPKDTVCVWTKGALPLLPRTDLIGFVELSGIHGRLSQMVPWDRAVEVVGDLMKPMGMWPERWETLGFPNDEQLKEMGPPCHRET